MNGKKIFNYIILALVVVLIAMRFFGKDDKKQAPQSKEEIIMEVIHQRKSVRSYLDKAVEDEKITTLLKAAMAAPTARNEQPWHFVVVKGRAALDSLAAELPYAQMLKEAPLAIVVCGELNKEDPSSVYWALDCSAATENLLLAAEAMGLGAVWTAVYPNEDRIRPVNELLSIPEGYCPLNVIPVGYPKGPQTPKNKWKPEKVHYEKW